MTLEPASFYHYRVRQGLLAERFNTKDPVRFQRLNLLLAQLETFEHSDDPKQRSDLAVLIERQMKIVAG